MEQNVRGVAASLHLLLLPPCCDDGKASSMIHIQSVPFSTFHLFKYPIGENLVARGDLRALVTNGVNCPKNMSVIKTHYSP